MPGAPSSSMRSRRRLLLIGELSVQGSGSSPGPGSTPGDGAGRNCLSVKTEITVDGKPVDAFGEACLLADGSWRLRPTEATD